MSDSQIDVPRRIGRRTGISLRSYINANKDAPPDEIIAANDNMV